MDGGGVGPLPKFPPIVLGATDVSFVVPVALRGGMTLKATAPGITMICPNRFSGTGWGTTGNRTASEVVHSGGLLHVMPGGGSFTDLVTSGHVPGLGRVKPAANIWVGVHSLC